MGDNRDNPGRRHGTHGTNDQPRALLVLLPRYFVVLFLEAARLTMAAGGSGDGQQLSCEGGEGHWKELRVSEDSIITKGSLSYLSSPCFSKNVLQSGVGIVH